MTTKNGDMPAMYVLRHSSGRFFKEQNLYLGIAELTDDIDASAKMGLSDAERNFECMSEKDEWGIFRVDIGFRLGEESDRHLRQKKKERLARELAELAKADGG